MRLKHLSAGIVVFIAVSCCADGAAAAPTPAPPVPITPVPITPAQAPSMADSVEVDGYTVAYGRRAEEWQCTLSGPHLSLTMGANATTEIAVSDKDWAFGRGVYSIAVRAGSEVVTKRFTMSERGRATAMLSVEEVDGPFFTSLFEAGTIEVSSPSGIAMRFAGPSQRVAQAFSACLSKLAVL